MLLGISGWKGAGKDTVGSYLVEEYGFVRIAFADVLKDMCSDMFSIPRHHFDNLTFKESPITSLPVKTTDRFAENIHSFMAGELSTGHWTPRSLAILIGSTMRAVNPDYWVKRALSQVAPGGRFVITDMRYRSEAERISGVGGLLLRVERAYFNNSVDPSETDLDDHLFDRIIENRGTIDALHQAVDTFMLSKLETGNGLY